MGDIFPEQNLDDNIAEQQQIYCILFVKKIKIIIIDFCG